jgi:manganese transport protein
LITFQPLLISFEMYKTAISCICAGEFRNFSILWDALEFTLMKTRLLQLLLWSVIAAAFIGPGTLTTASAAGAGYGYGLLWTFLFALPACFFLHEMAARITIGSGYPLGEALHHKLKNSAWRGVSLLVGASIVFGCAAYQTGNILGAVSGLELLGDIPSPWAALSLSLVAGILVVKGGFGGISKLLGGLVGLMGLVFIGLALFHPHPKEAVFEGLLIPHIPEGAGWVVMGLIGTTIVPYNLFLGSRIGKSQTVGSMRVGLFFSIGVGGLISMAIVMVATGMGNFTDFPALVVHLETALGSAAKPFVGLGLFAAGFTSSITAPLAATFTWQQVTAAPRPNAWVGALVIGTGLVFSILGLQPIPIIIMAQGINGLLLPSIVVVIVWLVNDPEIQPKEFRNPAWMNILALVICMISLMIGLMNLLKALRIELPATFAGVLAGSALITATLGVWLLRRR